MAYLIVPMRSLGQDSWKIAAALMGRHIGGGNLCYYLCLQIHARWPVRFLSIFLLRITLSSSIVVDLVVYFPMYPDYVLLLWCVAVNYVAISDALGVSPSILAAGLAADNVICALYFTTLFALASKVPPEASASNEGV